MRIEVVTDAETPTPVLPVIVDETMSRFTPRAPTMTVDPAPLLPANVLLRMVSSVRSVLPVPDRHGTGGGAVGRLAGEGRAIDEAGPVAVHVHGPVPDEVVGEGRAANGQVPAVDIHHRAVGRVVAGDPAVEDGERALSRRHAAANRIEGQVLGQDHVAERDCRARRGLTFTAPPGMRWPLPRRIGQVLEDHPAPSAWMSKIRSIASSALVAEPWMIVLPEPCPRMVTLRLMSKSPVRALSSPAPMRNT